MSKRFIPIAVLLLQTSSEIVGRLPRKLSLSTGRYFDASASCWEHHRSPKRATVQSIAEAETYDRGYYTGIMGCFDGTSLQSAVMIRFVEQQSDGSLMFKAGGGITTRSDAEGEYQELLDKVYAPLMSMWGKP